MDKKVGIEKNIVSTGFKRGSPLDIYELSTTFVTKLDLQGMTHPSPPLLSLNSSAKSLSITMERMKREGGSS